MRDKNGTKYPFGCGKIGAKQMQLREILSYIAQGDGAVYVGSSIARPLPQFVTAQADGQWPPLQILSQVRPWDEKRERREAVPYGIR